MPDLALPRWPLINPLPISCVLIWGLISSWLHWQHSLQVMIQGFTLFAVKACFPEVSPFGRPKGGENGWFGRLIRRRPLRKRKPPLMGRRHPTSTRPSRIHAYMHIQ